MRNGLKRLTAMLLLLCTLASFIVPATFADGGSESVVASYNFILDSAIYGTAGSRNFAPAAAEMSRNIWRE